MGDLLVARESRQALASATPKLKIRAIASDRIQGRTAKMDHLTSHDSSHDHHDHSQIKNNQTSLSISVFMYKLRLKLLNQAADNMNRACSGHENKITVHTKIAAVWAHYALSTPYIPW